ncbi:CMP-sialic acid transporter 5 [Seminavis robusta]|uniref:CMP-sialic acid transporter 5 n=1 Tax=Seminavis robusta TaxID=568900 RepID=A0A9N8DS26_9STRA|nr:CMP-sialic acid transporter 5 [Seminavis robusta]|eukprot:Sro248_g098260.1 CMP-sialic acid transporter 5 (478) ;mRNA; r:17487-18920
MNLLSTISSLLLLFSCSIRRADPFTLPSHQPHLSLDRARAGIIAVSSRIPARVASLSVPPKHKIVIQKSHACPRRFSEATTTLLHALPHDQIIAGTSMGLLALQFGAMPTLQKKCVPRELCRSSILVAQEISKFTLSFVCFVSLVSPAQRMKMLQSWRVRQWIQLAGIPATLYAIQNYAKLMAYQHLPPVTYSVLNQTKTISAAWFCFYLLGIRQSALQMVSLVLLLTSALVIENVIPFTFFMGRKAALCTVPSTQQSLGMGTRVNHDDDNNSNAWSNRRKNSLRLCVHQGHGQDQLAADARCYTSNSQTVVARNSIPRDPHHFTRGVLPLLLANLTSGLAAALGQRVLQHHRRNLYLYGMELSSASLLLVMMSLLWSPDGKQLHREGLVRHWKPVTFLPIAAHAIGGLLVGIVTKYAGSVQKGFALIFGVLLSGLFQKWLSHEPITRNQVVGGMLACLSMWMHVSFPPSRSVPTPY